MARTPILAAGGIVVLDGPRPLIALVQRRKDDDWVLPKGKLKPKEKAMAAARREVIEETGHDVRVHEFLGAISYRAGGKPKLAQFWRMQAVAESGRKLARDIKAVEWLPLESAIEKLSLPLEQVFLRNIGPRALKHRAQSERSTRAARPESAARAQATVRTEAAVPNLPAVVTTPATTRKSFFELIFGAFRRRVTSRT